MMLAVASMAQAAMRISCDPDSPHFPENEQAAPPTFDPEKL